MKIIVNNEYTFDVPSELIVKDNKLYNTKTKEYEGVEGDIVTLKNKDRKPFITGSVDGFTCGSHVKLRGLEKTYDNVMYKDVDHVSCVKEIDTEKIIVAETTYC